MCRPFSPGRLSSPGLDSAPKFHGCRPSVRGDRALGRLIILHHLTIFDWMEINAALAQHLSPALGTAQVSQRTSSFCHMLGSRMFRHSYGFLSSAHPSAYPRNFLQSRRLCTCSLPNNLPCQQRDSSRLLSGLAWTERGISTGTLHLFPPMYSISTFTGPAIGYDGAQTQGTCWEQEMSRHTLQGH